MRQWTSHCCRVCILCTQLIWLDLSVGLWIYHKVTSWPEYKNLPLGMGWTSTERPGNEATLHISYLVAVSNSCPQNRSDTNQTLSSFQAKSGQAFENTELWDKEVNSSILQEKVPFLLPKWPPTDWIILESLFTGTQVRTHISMAGRSSLQDVQMCANNITIKIYTITSKSHDLLFKPNYFSVSVILWPVSEQITACS